jgi:hypothetical protein
MRGVIPPLPQYAFMVWCSVKVKGHYLYLLASEGSGHDLFYILLSSLKELPV